MKSKNNIITALDIGTTKITCLAATVAHHKLRIIGASSQLANGFKNGIITDLKQAENSVISAVETAEKMAGDALDKVVVSISGGHINSSIITSAVNTANHPISQRDVSKVINLGLEQFNQANQDVINYFPLEYALDGQSGIKDPVSMYGSKLTCRLHVMSASSNSVLNLANCLARCQLDTDDFIISSYASAMACLTQDELELGALFIDIGGYIATLSIVSGGNFIYTDSVAIGGVHITSDIAQCFSINMAQAERVKILHGNVIHTPFEEHKIIELSAAGEDDQYEEHLTIPMAVLADVIRSRSEEIFEMIKNKLETAGYGRSFPRRIVLTGGTSQLMGIKELAANFFSASTRVAGPKMLEGLPQEYRGPSFSTAVGMLEIVGQDLIKSRLRNMNSDDSGSYRFLSKLFKWF